MLLAFVTLLLDWLDAIGGAIALVALLHPRRRSLRGPLPGWVAGLLVNRSSDLDRFLATARACPATQPPARRDVPRLTADPR